MEARVAGVPEDEESGLLPRPLAAGRRPSSRGPRFSPPPAVWATVDGPLGLPLEEAEGHARRFFFWGFACLPFLWAINCCYFWPVLRSPAASSPAAFGSIRPYILRSVIGFTIEIDQNDAVSVDRTRDLQIFSLTLSQLSYPRLVH
ncbi:unnamed protein product [Urochloa humidicola]